MAGCVLLLHVLNKLRQTRFPPPASKELSVIPFISPENIGLYTRVKLCVPEEKQDQSPSPLCVVIKPTAGSSHYAIRASMQTWSMAPQALLLTSPAPPHPQHLYIVKKAKQPDGCGSVCCETLWCNTSSPPSSMYMSTFPFTDCFQLWARWGECGTSTRGLGFSKIHTSLLYLTGNYMELWHNGDQVSGAAISAGVTDSRPAVQRGWGFVTSALSSPRFHSPLSVIAPSPDCRSRPGQDQLSDHREGCSKPGPDYRTPLQE